MPVADDTPELNRFLPADRRQALASGEDLPAHAEGTVLFADIGGFTPLSEMLAETLGPQQGAEAVAGCVQRIFDALADAVHRHHGSIITFAGDAITCWFDDRHADHAIAAAFEMQAAMETVGLATVPGVEVPQLGLKVALAFGEARRVAVGDPGEQLFDVLAGEPVDLSGDGEKRCRPGEVILDRASADSLAKVITTGEERDGFVCVTGLTVDVEADPWPEIPEGRLADDAVRSWIVPAIRERLGAGPGHLLAEFRPVVTMFVSFEADDTGAPGQFDAVVRRVQTVVQQRGGSIGTVSVGDKGSYLLAVFGAPVAHGDDVRRAVTAAQQIRDDWGAAVRIGLHEGRVFAGLYPGRIRSAYTVVGDSVNLAARLMTAAAPGQILMTASVGESLDRRFSISALEPITVKGRAAPVPVCLLVGTTSDASLTEPRHALPIVGRNRELSAIDDAIDDAKEGRGGVLAFVGDPGLGKSRLMTTAILRADDEGFAVFVGECQPESVGTAYLPWQQIWNAMLGLPHDGSDDERRHALGAVLSNAAPEAAPLAPLLSAVLGLPMDDTDATRDMPAPVRKQVLEQVLAGMLRGRSGAGPVCIVLDDVHWIDALSRDLLTTLAGSISDVPVLVVLAYRPEEVTAPLDISREREFMLDELDEEGASELATMLLGQTSDEPVDPSAVAAVTARAGGNPFFIEELAREIRDRGGKTSELPTSLEHLILERLDRLPAAQQHTAKVASIVGRRFETKWLTGAFADTLDAELVPSDLDGLGSSGLIVTDTPLPEEAHLFRHALVRDVAYETLGFAVRASLHEQLARYLEQTAATPPLELLAYHYARSANTAKEAEYRRLAAEVAIRNGAYADALEHVQRASEIVAGQEDGPDKLEQELELALMLGSILLVTDGQGSARAKEVYDHARALSRELPPGPAVGRAVFGLWTYYLFQGLMAPTAELADEAVALSEHSPDPGVRIMAHLAVSQTHMWTGEWHRCIEHYDRVVELYEPSEHQAYITQYAQNPRFTASNSAFWAEWMLGHPERAAVIGELAISEAKELNHEFTYTIAFLGRPLVAWFRRRDDEFAASVDDYVATAERAGNPFYIALARSLQASAQVLSGDADGGLAQLESQFDAMHALGSKLVDPLMVSLLGEAYLAAGRYDEGLDLVDRSIERFARDGQVSWLPDHLRLRAALALQADAGALDASLTTLARASEVARSHDALSLELRCTLAETALRCESGHDDAAPDAIAAVYERFTEGFEDPDLVAARTFLP
jgi:class 3 adenylate cyclase/tetratricopeptide (TPR) repeat protein